MVRFGLGNLPFSISRLRVVVASRMDATPLELSLAPSSYKCPSESTSSAAGPSVPRIAPLTYRYFPS